MVLEIALCLLFLSEHKLKVPNLNLESFVCVRDSWRFWDIRSVKKYESGGEIFREMYVDKEYRN